MCVSFGDEKQNASSIKQTFFKLTIELESAEFQPGLVPETGTVLAQFSQGLGLDQASHLMSSHYLALSSLATDK